MADPVESHLLPPNRLKVAFERPKSLATFLSSYFPLLMSWKMRRTNFFSFSSPSALMDRRCRWMFLAFSSATASAKDIAEGFA